jgi:hypothetical protein
VKVGVLAMKIARRLGACPSVKVESRSGSLKVKTDTRLRAGRRGLRRLHKREFSSLDGYDRVVDVEDKVYSESFELVERGLPFGV